MGATFVAEDARVSRIAGRIVRVLYFREFNRSLPAHHAVVVYVAAMIDGSKSEAITGLRTMLDFALGGQLRIVHRDVFLYALNVAKSGADDATVWLLQFYGDTPIVCTTADRARYQMTNTTRPLY